jgi:hypothetical protein
MAATASTPSASSITSSTATISCNFFPNTLDSTVTATMQYRVNGSGSGYTNGTTSGYATSGYSQTTASAAITGLAASTTYEIRLSLTRTTSNDTSLTSTTSTFTTSANAPGITTGSASSVGANAATLNGSIVAHSISTTLSFDYGLTTSYGSTSPATPSSTSSDISFSANIDSLVASTLYHFRAVGTYSGGTVNGSDATFTTSADPQAVALLEDHLLTFDFDAVYGVQKAFVFTAASPAATSSDKFLNAAAPWATTECIILIDGALSTVVNPDGRSTNAPTRVGSTGYYTITLTAAELTGENIFVFISDTGNAARDVLLHIRTSQELGKQIVDATQYGSNNSAVTLTGVGTGYGWTATGGATATGDMHGRNDSAVMRANTATAGGASTITLDASASSTDDYYNGAVIMITSGTGAGQARVISDYVGGTLVATVNRSWSTNPASGSKFIIIGGSEVWDLAPTAELSALPTSTSNYSKFIQFLFQRFAYKRTQTATTFTAFKADSSTSLATGTVSDDGTTETSGKLS